MGLIETDLDRLLEAESEADAGEMEEDEPPDPFDGRIIYRADIPGLDKPLYLRAKTKVSAYRFLRAMLPSVSINDGVKFEVVPERPEGVYPITVPSESDDFTTEKEAIFLPRKGTKHESPSDRGRIARLEDWRARKAKTPVPDDLPQWGRWSEFYVFVDPAQTPVNVIHDGETGPMAWHLEYRGPISETGYRSHFLTMKEIERAKEIGIVQFAAETARRLNAEVQKEFAKRLKLKKSPKPKPAKEKKPKAPPMSEAMKKSVVETLRELGIHDCPKSPAKASAEPAGPEVPAYDPVGFKASWELEAKDGFEVVVRDEGDTPYRFGFKFEPGDGGGKPAYVVTIRAPKSLGPLADFPLIRDVWEEDVRDKAPRAWAKVEAKAWLDLVQRTKAAERSRAVREDLAITPEPPAGLPRETPRPEPSWEVGSRWTINVRHGDDGFAEFTFRVDNDLGGGDCYREVIVGRPAFLAFDPIDKPEVARIREVAGPREWSVALAERMMADQLRANQWAAIKADRDAQRREDEPRWGRPQAFEVSVQIAATSYALVKAELREDDADAGVWLSWPMRGGLAEFYPRNKAETKVTPRHLVESIACARYGVEPPKAPGFEWGKPDRFTHKTFVDGKDATFRVRVERNEDEGSWIVTIAPPEWLGESSHIFEVDELTAEACVVDDFVSDQIDAILKARKAPAPAAPKKLIDMTEDELDAAIEKSRAEIAARPPAPPKPPAEKPLGPPPSTWEDQPVSVLSSAPGKLKATPRVLNALSLAKVRTLGELKARMWDDDVAKRLRRDDPPHLRDMLESWLKAHVAAKVDDGSAIDEELGHALFRLPQAAVRWKERLRRGVDDKELRQAIGQEFGINGSGGGQGRAGFSVRGGQSPGFKLGTNDAKWIDGQPLVDRVRRLLAIPLPAGAEKPKPKRARKEAARA